MEINAHAITIPAIVPGEIPLWLLALVPLDPLAPLALLEPEFDGGMLPTAPEPSLFGVKVEAKPGML